MAIIFITGGARGIGYELAKQYKAAGDEVIVGARDPAKASERLGGIEALPLDVADPASVEALSKAMEGRKIDVLINNAGITGPAPQTSTVMDFEGFAHTLEVNTLGPLRVTQALLPCLKRSDNAKLAVISSYMGALSSPQSGNVAYRVSKAAVNKLVTCMAVDFRADEIAVASIHPGWVRTDMGGPNAAVAPEDSGAGIKALMDRLTLAETGKFWNYDGTTLEW